MPRFQKAPTWKHLLTKRDSVVVCDLSKLASNRTGRFELGGPAFMEGFVPSHDSRVWLNADDGFDVAGFDPFYAQDPFDMPRLSEGVRLLYSFRREELFGSTTPWVIRHAGPVLEVEDDADTDRRRSRFVAYDPWAYLYQRPVRRADPDPNTPDLNVNPMPRESGTVFPAGTPGNEIVAELLRRTIIEDGLTYIDAGTAFGGTADYNGTMETTATFLDPIVFPRGMSVGEAWAYMVDTGTLDIVLRPIWDPIDRPGYCVELDIFETAGGTPLEAYDDGFPSFHWDRSGHQLIRINRHQEGRERANRIRAFAGGTGAASNPWTGHLGDLHTFSPDTESSWSDSASAARYGESWVQPTYVRQTANDQVSRQAQDDLIRRRTGFQTWRLYPAPEFSPLPFNDYMPGSYLSFYHSDRLRDEQWWIPESFNDQEISPRVSGFTIALSDDALETVTQLDINVGNPDRQHIS